MLVHRLTATTKENDMISRNAVEVANELINRGIIPTPDAAFNGRGKRVLVALVRRELEMAAARLRMVVPDLTPETFVGMALEAWMSVAREVGAGGWEAQRVGKTIVCYRGAAPAPGQVTSSKKAVKARGKRR
jgi:hypothetical protein